MLRTTGTSWSGQMPGSGGRLPVVSRIALVIRRKASCDLVRLHGLQMARRRWNRPRLRSGLREPDRKAAADTAEGDVGRRFIQHHACVGEGEAQGPVGVAFGPAR